MIDISDDPTRLDLDAIHGFLTTSYWASGIPRSVIERAISGSLCVGAFDGAHQVGFARVVTDRATFAYLADVYVLESHRGRGVARRMVAVLRAHPDLQGLRRWMLATRDAHDVYAPLGFRRVAQPERFMEIIDLDVYSSSKRPT